MALFRLIIKEALHGQLSSFDAFKYMFAMGHHDFFHLLDAWIHFCTCDKIATTWCDICGLRGYCSQSCREKDKKSHNAMCQPNLELLRQSLADVKSAAVIE